MRLIIDRPENGGCFPSLLHTLVLMQHTGEVTVHAIDATVNTYNSMENGEVTIRLDVRSFDALNRIMDVARGLRQF